ncbi:GNL3 protein, partial [Acromyrmex insinuator]
MPARKRYKIEKKVRKHNRKMRKEAKDSKRKSKVVEISNNVKRKITKTMQIVQLDSKIKLLVSPGIVFASSDENSDDTSVALKYAVRIQALTDPFKPATAILKRVSRQQIMQLYSMKNFSTPDEFFAMKAIQMGKFKKGGIPDATAIVRGITEDWNSGKIRYYIVPPEQPICHISAEIVNQVAKKFDIESFVAEERKIDNFTTHSTNNPTTNDPVLINSRDPVTTAMKIEIQKEAEYKVQKKFKKKLQDTKKDKSTERKKKPDPLFEIKKERLRRATIKLVGQLEEFKFTFDDYDFNTDFTNT